MRERFAIVSFKLPLRLDYPWKAGQRLITAEVEGAVADGIRYLDCVPQGARFEITVKVVEREQPASTGGQ